MTSHYIRGYAALFNVVNRWEDRGPLIVRPGAFSLAGASVPLCFGHDDRHSYASTRDGSLKIWQDDVGLAFEAAPHATQAGLALVHGIARRTYDRVSVCYASGYAGSIERIGGEEVEVVTWTRVEEISICSAGACDPARVWHADHPSDALDPGAQALHRKWALGHQRHVLLRARASGDGQTRPAARRIPIIPASVQNFLSSAAFAATSDKARKDAMIMAEARRKGSEKHCPEAGAARPITGRSILGISGITCAANQGQSATAAHFLNRC